MANASVSSARTDSTMAAFLTLAGRRARRILAASTLAIFVVTVTVAQESAPGNAPAASVTIPAGSHLALVLTNPISTTTTHRGDDIHAQLTAPVTLGDQVVIPAGTFVQGKVEKLHRNGSRGEMLLQSASVVFPDGYVAQIAGPLTIESDEGTAWINPSGRAKAGAIIAPMAGLGIGAAIGAAAHTTNSMSLGGQTITQSSVKGVAIGSMVGLAIGGVTSLVLLTRSHGFYVDSGSPMQMALPQPLTLSQNQVSNAVREARDHPPEAPMPAPRPRPVYSPDMSPTSTPTPQPPLIIPGVPDANGVPGPPTIIPQ